MDPQLLREWRRWAASEQAGATHEDEADAALRDLFRAVPVRVPSAGFAGQVSSAVAREVRREARLVRAGLLTGAVCALVLAIAFLIQMPRLLSAALDLTIRAVVSSTIALGRGLDLWTLLAQLARAIGSIVVTPQVTYALIGLASIAIGALYALHRMLELEEGPLP
jgi:hypothetical protein